MSKEKPTTTEQEKATTPWRVRFTCGKAKPTYTDIRKDLLAATWGNNRMADLLYHFLVVASWEAHNNHIGEATKKVVVNETHAKIQTKVKISEPTLVSHLKAFSTAGYVRKTAYRGSFEVDLEAIEKAFSNAPQKQATGQSKTSDLSLNLSLSKEVQDLREEVRKLTDEVQNLSLTLVSFKFQQAQNEHGFKFNFSLPLVSANSDETATVANLAHIFKFAETKELYLNKSSGLALADGGRPQNFPKNILDIRYIDSLDKEREEEDGFATATPSRTLPFSEELDLFSEDLLPPPFKKSDSDSHQPSETSQPSEQTKSGAASDYGKTEETQQTRKRRNRKPAAPKVDMAEVELYLDVFDELYREISKEPETGYGRTGVDREAIIKDLLTPKLTNPKFVTPDKLKAVYRALYKKPKDEKTGFCWADNMSIKAVCRNYAKEAMTLAARAKEREAQSRAASTPSSNSTLDNLRRLQAKFVGTATAAVQGGL